VSQAETHPGQTRQQPSGGGRLAAAAASVTAVAGAPPGAARRSRLARLPERVPWLTPGDWAVLRVWLISRVATLALSWAAIAYVEDSSSTGGSRPWLALWPHFDAIRLQHIAQYGYFGPPGHVVHFQVALFPGFPLAQALLQVLIRQWVVSGLLVSLIAGSVAAVALGRIAELDYRPGTGTGAVLYLVASPAAFFLAAGYTEALFLAFALTAWLAARRGRWLLAALLAGGASLIRVNGLFLLAALMVAALRSPAGWAGHADGDRAEATPAQRIRALAALLPALIPPAAYEVYLKVRTGDWLAWSHAEANGWDRMLTSPLDSLRNTWEAGFGHGWLQPHTPDHNVVIAYLYQLEIVAVATGLVAVIVLAARRRWPEAVYTGLTIGVLATSTLYQSVPRALLLLWPVWCGLAVAAARRAWVGQLYLAVSVPVAAMIGLLFMTGNWAG